MLFLCTNNSVRSQIAAAFLRKHSDEFDVFSAGTLPADMVHPFAVQTMNELGIDISRERPRHVSEYLGRLVPAYVVVVCKEAEEHCARTWPGSVNRLFWPFDDPTVIDGADEERLAAFRKTRDEIAARVRSWVDDQSKP